MLAALVFAPAGASAAEPPWCGTPEPDASLALDGFADIPYHAIGCTLEDIRYTARAQHVLERFGDKVKVPIVVQGGIHGNEYEGVDSAIDISRSTRRRTLAGGPQSTS